MATLGAPCEWARGDGNLVCNQKPLCARCYGEAARNARQLLRKFDPEGFLRIRTDLANGSAIDRGAAGLVTVDDIRNALEYAAHFGCELCEFNIEPGEKWEIDHKKPLSRDGQNLRGNVRIVHKECNRDKGRSEDFDFHQSSTGAYGQCDCGENLREYWHDLCPECWRAEQEDNYW